MPTITEASAIFTLLQLLGHDTTRGRVQHRPEDRDIVTAVQVLGQRAGKTLQLTQDPDELAESARRFLRQLAAADSDGAAQAVCRGLDVHVTHGGTIPWPTIRTPFEEWQAIQARQAALDAFAAQAGAGEGE